MVRGELHDDEPVLVVAAIEEDRLLGWAVAPVRRRVVQGRVTRPGCFGSGLVCFGIVRGELELGIEECRESEARTRRRRRRRRSRRREGSGEE